MSDKGKLSGFDVPAKNRDKMLKHSLNDVFRDS